MAELIRLEEFQKEKAIELGDGTILNIPPRTAELYESLVAIEKNKAAKSEYDYCKAMLELLFGKDIFKKIAPQGKKTNLDYLAHITIVAQELFLSEKIEAEKAEMEKQNEMLAPLVGHLKTIVPFAEKLK